MSKGTGFARFCLWALVREYRCWASRIARELREIQDLGRGVGKAAPATVPLVALWFAVTIPIALALELVLAVYLPIRVVVRCASVWSESEKPATAMVRACAQAGRADW